MINYSSEPYILISRQRYLQEESMEMFTYRLFAFVKDTSDQSNITFQLIPSIYSNLFQLNSNGLLTIFDLLSIIELDYSLTDTFINQPYVKQDELILLIGQTLIDRDYLIQQYQK